MELYLQFGHGMMALSEELIKTWQSGTVILSPRDLNYDQLKNHSRKLISLHGGVVFDPQFYVPNSHHHKLTSHSYWPYDFKTAWLNNQSIYQMLQTIKNEYNDEFETLFFILPSIRSTEIGDDWKTINEMVVNEATRLNTSLSLYATLCLSEDVMNSEEQIHMALEIIEEWEIDGCYIVPEPPKNNYLVENPNWLINLIDLATGIKHQGKKVVVGYSNHQMIYLALARVEAIASGNWLNVRGFSKARFDVPEEGQSRRSKWYYCPQALSEYQIPFLDIAHRSGFLDELKAPDSFNSTYSQVLFSGAQPTSTDYKERDSFMHYLHCLKQQCEQAEKESYEATKAALKLQLDTSSELTEFFRSQGIRGRARDFNDVVDVNISAIDAFDSLRGMVHAHKWDEL